MVAVGELDLGPGLRLAEGDDVCSIRSVEGLRPRVLVARRRPPIIPMVAPGESPQYGYAEALGVKDVERRVYQPVDPLREGRSLEEILERRDFMGMAGIRELLYETVYKIVAADRSVWKRIGLDLGVWVERYDTTGLLRVLAGLYGLDIDPATIELAQARYQNDTKFRAMQMDLFELPAFGTEAAEKLWSNGQPTVAILAGILDGLGSEERIETAVTTVVRALPPGSRLFIQTGNRQGGREFEPIRVMFGERTPQFGQRSLADMLERARVDVEVDGEVAGIYYWESPASLTGVASVESQGMIPLFVTPNQWYSGFGRLSTSVSSPEAADHVCREFYLDSLYEGAPEPPYLFAYGVTL